jgi:hypothetical protein
MTTIIVISTEGRNHTRGERTVVEPLYVISPFGRNDKNRQTNFELKLLTKLKTYLITF